MADVRNFRDELVEFRMESPVEDMQPGAVYRALVFDVDHAEAREVARLLFKRIINGHRMSEKFFGSFFGESLRLATENANPKRRGYNKAYLARPTSNEFHVAEFNSNQIDYGDSKEIRARKKQKHLEETLWRALDTNRTVNIHYNGKLGGQRIHTVRPVKLYTDMFYGRHAGGLRRYNYDRIQLINISAEPNPPMIDGFPTQLLFTVTFDDEMNGTLRISQYRAEPQHYPLEKTGFTRWSLKRADRLWMPLRSSGGFVSEGV